MTGLDVLRGRTPWEGIGVVRAHEGLAGLRTQWGDVARIADLLVPRGRWAGESAVAPESELFVPGDGDILEAVGGGVVPAGALDDELVRTRGALDAAMVWIWANPGHWVSGLRLVWPDVSVDERNTLRRQICAVAIANFGLVGAAMVGTTLMVVGALLALGLA